MGNTPGKPHQRPKNKKYLQFIGAERPVPPGKPYLATELEATPDLLTIRWDPPVKNGGSPITGYLVEHRRTGSTHWVKASPVLVRVPELTLGGLEPGWRYQFRVFAENVVGISDSSELSEPLTVTLESTRSAITPPKFTQELSDTVALENEKVEFVVHFIGQPAPKLCWFKDGFEIFSSRRTRIFTEHDRSVLTIHQSAICDEGEIKCTATNKAGHASIKARLVLEAPPSIRLPRQYEDGLLFEIGELIRFKISVAGLPPPLIFWTHNGESINENERYEIENDNKTSTLRIAEADRNDRGEYQIKAINKLGSDLASFLVTVTDKPSPPGKAKVVMTLGRSVTLSWNTPDDDGGSKIGSYIVEYYRLGWNVWLKAATSRQLTTILGDLIEGSEYKFRVKAESPFGVSEPSEESELVFIPDPKRGMLEPTKRSRSQPRDVVESIAPVATKRKKPRSHSSSRAGDIEDESEIPIKPARIKSPPKTPERLSPHVERKEVNTSAINKAIFDRATMARELTYGSPEIKIKKTDVPIPKQEEIQAKAMHQPNQSLQDTIKSSIQIQDNQKPKLPPKPAAVLPIQESSKPVQELSPVQTPKIELTPSPTLPPKISKAPAPTSSPKLPPKNPKEIAFESKLKERSPSPRMDLYKEKTPELRRFVKERENLGGSTEFMMVLYTNDNQREIGSTSEFGFELENISVAPPLSLSAPELGAEPPPMFDNLRLSASSTELLHERAMVRFYQEALAEEEAIRRRIEMSDERRSSLVPRIQISNERDGLGLERKHSLRRRLSAGGSMPQQLLMAQKRQSLRNSGEFSDLFDTKSPKYALTVEEKREMMQTRQRSHSEEREEEEFERIRAKLTQPKPRKKISVVQEEEWEYEESLSEEESSEDERYVKEPKIRELTPDEEEETYHPRAMMLPQEENKSKYIEPFEILTKPAKLPEPNFVPKPILKKKDNGEVKVEEEPKKIEPEPIVAPKEESVTSKVAMAGMTAAGIIISQPLLQEKEAEESKIVIEHYGELVRNVSQKRVRGRQMQDSAVREALKKQAQLQAALHQSDEEEEEIEPPKPTINVRALDDRFQKTERKIEQPPRSATPIFKQRQRLADDDDIFNKKPIETNKMEPIKKIEPPKEAIKIIEPIKPTELIESSRGRDQTRYGAPKRTVSQSKSPKRGVSQQKARKSSPSPAPKTSRSNSKARPTKKPQSRSNSSVRTQSRSNSSTRPTPPSPTPQFLRKPKMCEIMTQTSTSIEDPFPMFPSISSPIEEDLKTSAQITVRTSIDYITDLAMFAVACWVFVFSNELLALPILLVAVYRQLKDEVKRRIPNWIKRRWNKEKK